ncbi:hypothetical protein [Deinococcus aestuarii]|uniref:hypothetical protein n=1 Tax=Deinococcus aestuarii TaxID=2774531 RepID=UPI001C0DF040|nr:hypothetical protein [Deinococcus aestuarii]
MMEDTTPLGKSVEEIERDSGNLDPARTSDDSGTQGGVVIPPTGLGGAGGTVTGTGMGVPVIPTVGGTGQADEDENT